MYLSNLLRIIHHHNDNVTKVRSLKDVTDRDIVKFNRVNECIYTFIL